tara:strand:+ start:134 stop:346 length:213 start_codon:yes stop_codon:yes gene_type:complete
MSKFDFITGFFSWGEPEKVKPEPTPEPELREPDLPEVETRKRSDRKPGLSSKSKINIEKLLKRKEDNEVE